MHASPAPDQHSAEQRPCRLIIVALIFVAGSLLSSGRMFWDARTPQHARGSSIDIEERSDQRFADIKTLLPKRGVIGYIGESGALARGDYYLAEYALAPLVVDDSTNHPLILANFPNLPMASPPNLQLMQDFGNGVALFANKDAR